MTTLYLEYRTWRTHKALELVARGSMQADPRRGEGWWARLVRLLRGAR